MIQDYRVWNRSTELMEYLPEVTKYTLGDFVTQSELVLLMSTGVWSDHSQVIYEGDIINTGVYLGYCEVVYENGCFMLVSYNKYKKVLLGYPNIEPNTNYVHSIPDNFLKFIIVGNIYQNPELKMD